ncbi:MAG: RNA 3'-terminal phosphate cyclase [Planctomycetota bacterium]|nr:RNA 3'-terminal phosphate cyclase [Planctomycetota bacterium]
MLVLDGAQGEGGGQVLRTALGLSLLTGTPFRIERIRANRSPPGLRRQHLTAVEAAAAVGDAEVVGAGVGASALTFSPRRVRTGDFRFAVGTAGSCTLVLQTVLPALMLQDAPSRLVLEGGTHNPMAPPFDFLARVYAPLLARLGPRLTLELERPGFYPAGGGRLVAEVAPVPALRGVELLERGPIVATRATALVCHLPRHVGERELDVVRRKLRWAPGDLEVVDDDRALGPGNALLLEVEARHAREVVTGFGQRGVRAEDVARGAVAELQRWLDADVPVGEHLCDQLLLLLAIAGEGAFRTLPLSGHATTQLDVMSRFLPARVQVSDDAAPVVRVARG